MDNSQANPARPKQLQRSVQPTGVLPSDGPKVVLMSRDEKIAGAVQWACGSEATVALSWTDWPMARLLVIDTRSLTATAWRDLASFSRIERRPAILLLGHPSDAPALLAVVAADAYVRADLAGESLHEHIREHLGERQFLIAARSLARVIAAPDQLARFFTVVFTARPAFASVTRAALATGCSETTLRYQLRRCVGPGVKLKHIVRLVRILRGPPARHAEAVDFIARWHTLKHAQRDTILQALSPVLGIITPRTPPPAETST